MAISLPDARQLSDEVLEALRVRALRGRELGLSEEQLANVLGVARETVSRWWTAYQKGGVQALPHERSGRPTGSGRTLSNEQAVQFRSCSTNRCPTIAASPHRCGRAARCRP
jgi:transposase